jgi:tRNA G18 (ribose-2'-O)-methylase SpoU
MAGFGIVVERGKTWENMGGIIRSAGCFGARFVAVVGARYSKQRTDTMCHHKQFPVFSFPDWETYRNCCPFDWIPFAVEIKDGVSIRLDSFIHPKNAVYFIGPEDGSLSNQAVEMCKAVIKIPAGCLNQHVAASIIMYDRISKELP